MRSFRRLALMLALSMPAMPAIQAQSSTSNPPAPDQDQARPQQTPGLNTQEQTVQARIRARREQRRAAAIHDAYSHLYEAYVGMGYLRFSPGPTSSGLLFTRGTLA